MNPYLIFSIVMCVVVGLSLAGTAYLAAMFNRRAKNDLQVAFDALSGVIDGETDVDEAMVTGRFEGHIVNARVGSPPNKVGRAFIVELVDGAGGSAWTWTGIEPKEKPAPMATEWESGLEEGEKQLCPVIADEVSPLLRARWVQASYDPATALIKLVYPMQSRRNLPGAEEFSRQVRALKIIADLNRSLQYTDTESA